MNKHDTSLSAGISRYVVKNVLFLCIIAVVLFVSSGTLKWGMSWVFLAVLAAVSTINMIVMDPALLAERSKLQEGTKRWDILLSGFAAIWGPLMVWAAAGLDVRCGWSEAANLPLQLSALAVFILGSMIVTWAMKSNSFFSATVRIQKDRNHQVASAGPYRFVRHPGYTGGILAMLAAPIALGSWAALIPGILVAAAYILRTYLEDKVLLEELDGYKEFAVQVPYRLVPLIW